MTRIVKRMRQIANIFSSAWLHDNLPARGKGVPCITHPEVLAFSSCGLEPEGKSLSTRRTKHVYELVLHTSVFHLKKDHTIFFTELLALGFLALLEEKEELEKIKSIAGHRKEDNQGGKIRAERRVHSAASKIWKKLSFITVSFRMSIFKVLLFILFVASDSLSEQEALKPNCTAVEDFKACLGNTDNFCPTNISCQCKNEKPFCRCDYFRVDWKEYWYMGPKCNHLWNTLDLILVTILPAVALVIIVVGIFYCVYYCKSEKAGANQASFKDWNETNPPYREAQYNPGFSAETAGNLGHVYQQSLRDVWVRQIPKVVLGQQDFDDPTPHQLENYSSMHPQPLRRPDPATDHFSNQRPQNEKFGDPRNNFPYASYAEGRQYRKY